MQQIQIIGNVGRDAEQKEHNGRPFLTFSVACNETHKDQNGEKVSRTTWFDCVFDRVNVRAYLKKGTKVFIQGNFRVSMYKDRDGQWQAGIKVNVQKLELLDSPSDRSTENDLPTASVNPAPAATQSANAGINGVPEAGSDDLPF